ncbi:MAG TPA: response regulator transcription factor [Cyclobacteriaceae bacterium]|nr:response regulator transcription factor [Cyclobacteriaceae bacterium]
MERNKLLYVEDEPFLGRIVKESLESRNFSVSMTDDGSSALELFKRVQPDICVLDVMLPGKDGYAIAKEIRNVKSDVPIIFVTAKTQTQDVIKGFESGGNDYIKKPFSVEELLVRINNLLHLTNSKSAAMPESIRFGRFEFLPLRYELKMEGIDKKLSHREATLLHLLLTHKNTPILRKDILMKIWGDDSFFNSRNLDVYVAKLREYLKPDPSIKITTIKGHGYLFTIS